MSIGAICSLLTFSSCDVKKRINNDKNTRRVGVQTELLSLDPLSVNALGENVVLDLISPKVFKFDKRDYKLKSSFGSVLFNGRSLSFKNNESNKKLIRAFKKIKESVLWSASLKNLSISNKSKIICLELSPCIADFVNLVGILRSKEFSNYKIKKFIKTKNVLLKKINGKNAEYNYVKILNFKKTADAILYLKLNKIDIFYPKNDVGELEPELTYIKSKSKFKRLSLYHKHRKPLPKSFIKAFCNSKELINKTFLEWKSTFNVCENLSNIRFVNKNKLKIISDTKNVNKIFDLQHQFINKNFILDYRVLKGFKLNESLKSGQFDLYLTEEIYDNSYNIFYEAYHSKGKYNTLEIKNASLDKDLEKLLKAETYKDYVKQQKKIKQKINKIEPLLIRFKKNFYHSISN